MQPCQLCNELFEQAEFDFNEVIQINGEYWHTACYAEYYDETLQET